MDKISFIVSCAERAAILEVDAHKPGNVSKMHNFDDTTYEDFIRGAKALRAGIENAANNGFLAGLGKKDLSEIEVGGCIKKIVEDVKKSHAGGNTHLGIAMLFVPIAGAAGMCIAEGDGFVELRKNLVRIMDNTTVQDSVNLYDAIKIANAGGLGKHEFDARKESSKEELKEKNINLQKLMELSSGKDRIAEELASGMPIIFDLGVPSIKGIFEETKNIEFAIVQTYLFMLSRFPDTLIAKKVGKGKAFEISERAERIMRAGGVLTEGGRHAIENFDKYLSSFGSELNPGTTADLIAASLMVCLLDGLEP